MWKYRVVTKLSSKMNSDHQLDDMDFDNDKSKPNGSLRSLVEFGTYTKVALFRTCK